VVSLAPYFRWKKLVNTPSVFMLALGMSRTLHVQRKDNGTFEVHVESPSSGERKVAGRFLDDARLHEELVHHGCTAEQIEKGLVELKDRAKESARISLDD